MLFIQVAIFRMITSDWNNIGYLTYKILYTKQADRKRYFDHYDRTWKFSLHDLISFIVIISHKTAKKGAFIYGIASQISSLNSPFKCSAFQNSIFLLEGDVLFCKISFV